MEYSFSASGWLFIYQLGVARTLQKHGLHREEYCCRFTGSSGGSLVSTCLAIDADIEGLKDYFLECVAECRAKPSVNMFKMRDYVVGAFKIARESYARTRAKPDCSDLEFLEASEFYRDASLVNGRLGVSVTLLPSFANAILTKFSNQEEVEQAILGSCTMSPLAGFPFRLNRPSDPNVHGKWVFDGGMANIQPYTKSSKNEGVITVSPFYFWDCDIKPSRYVPIWWGLFPPTVEEMESLYDLGVSDAENWLEINRNIFVEKQMVTRLSVTSTSIRTDNERNPLAFFIKRDEILSITRSVEMNMANLYRPITSNEKHIRTSRRTSPLQPEGIFNKTMDSVVIFAQKNLVKTLAVSTIYVELFSLASFNLAKYIAVSAESKRRALLPQSKSILSIRRWLPEPVLGSTSDSLNTSVSCARNLMKPHKIWTKVSHKMKTKKSIKVAHDDFPNEVTFEEAVCELSTYSFVFRDVLNYCI